MKRWPVGVQSPCRSASLHFSQLPAALLVRPLRSRAKGLRRPVRAGCNGSPLVAAVGSGAGWTPAGVVARVRLVADFRSDRMESPEGRGKARRAWDSYANAVGKVTGPALKPVLGPFVRRYAAGSIVDLVGFWAVWHLEGGFEGLQRLGMSRASIYRRIKLFRVAFGAHPDEFEMPGITLDLVEFREGWEAKKAAKAAAKAKAESQG